MRYLILDEQYLTDKNGDKIAVVLDIQTYTCLLDELDELRCQKGYEQVVQKTDLEIESGDYVTLGEYLAQQEKATS